MSDAKTTTAGIGDAVSQRITEIRSLVSLGWTLEAAIQRVRESSTLGVKSWEAILNHFKRA